MRAKSANRSRWGIGRNHNYGRGSGGVGDGGGGCPSALLGFSPLSAPPLAERSPAKIRTPLRQRDTHLHPTNRDPISSRRKLSRNARPRRAGGSSEAAVPLKL